MSASSVTRSVRTRAPWRPRPALGLLADDAEERVAVRQAHAEAGREPREFLGELEAVAHEDQGLAGALVLKGDLLEQAHEAGLALQPEVQIAEYAQHGAGAAGHFEQPRLRVRRRRLLGNDPAFQGAALQATHRGPLQHAEALAHGGLGDEGQHARLVVALDDDDRHLRGDHHAQVTGFGHGALAA